jgi:hypothetical protein
MSENKRMTLTADFVDGTTGEFQIKAPSFRVEDGMLRSETVAGESIGIPVGRINFFSLKESAS